MNARAMFALVSALLAACGAADAPEADEAEEWNEQAVVASVRSEPAVEHLLRGLVDVATTGASVEGFEYRERVTRPKGGECMRVTAARAAEAFNETVDEVIQDGSLEEGSLSEADVLAGKAAFRRVLGTYKYNLCFHSESANRSYTSYTSILGIRGGVRLRLGVGRED